jgi:hypothetical protein
MESIVFYIKNFINPEFFNLLQIIPDKFNLSHPPTISKALIIFTLPLWIWFVHTSFDGFNFKGAKKIFLHFRFSYCWQF